MKKLLNSALVAAATMTLPTTAFAETLAYDFSMEITSMYDSYGVFNGLSVGDSLNLSVLLDSKATGDGNAVIKIAEVSVTSTGSWASAWSDVQYNASGLTWDAYSGSVSGSMLVNGISIGHTVSYHQDLFLDFSAISSGDYQLTSGWLDLRLENTGKAGLKATFVPKPPTSVPELDAKSSAQAAALLAGAAFIFMSRRRAVSPESAALS